MKHLVKKHVKSLNVADNVSNVFNNAQTNSEKLIELKDSNLNGFYGIVHVENKLVQAFKYFDNNKVYLIPEPDPIVIYFDTAIIFHKEIKALRDRLFAEATPFENNIFAVNSGFHWYYSRVSNYIIFLFLAIEAFTNKIIPSDFEYRKNIGDKKVELYNKSQIQRHVDFLEKVKDVLPIATAKNFVVEYGHMFDQIKKLKNFRDQIVHTKSFEVDNFPNYYEELFRTSLDFDFDNTLYYVRDFINYYQPELIQECNCGNDI